MIWYIQFALCGDSILFQSAGCSDVCWFWSQARVMFLQTSGEKECNLAKKKHRDKGTQTSQHLHTRKEPFIIP